ncbi:MAG: hypothetical protein V1837_04420 [Candidatus Woesearchaeota archaeon]
MRDKAIQKILQIFKITDQKLDLVERVLALEGDKKVLGEPRVCIWDAKLHLEVELNKNFNSLIEFRQYLKNHNLPYSQDQVFRNKREGYTLQVSDVPVYFSHEASLRILACPDPYENFHFQM